MRSAMEFGSCRPGTKSQGSIFIYAHIARFRLIAVVLILAPDMVIGDERGIYGPFPRGDCIQFPCRGLNLVASRVGLWPEG